MILENLSPDAAEGLAPLVAQDSPLEAGRYVVKHTKEATASAWNEQVQSTVWFRTPVRSPLSAAARDRIV